MTNNYTKTSLTRERNIAPRRWTTIYYVLCPLMESPKAVRPALPDVVFQAFKPWVLEMEADVEQRRALIALEAAAAGYRARDVRIYPDAS